MSKKGGSVYPVWLYVKGNEGLNFITENSLIISVVYELTGAKKQANKSSDV